VVKAISIIASWKFLLVVMMVVTFNEAQQPIIERFTMPPQLEQLFTSEALARRINDKMRDIYRRASESAREDFAVVSAEKPPDLKLPGIDIGQRTIIEYVQKLFGFEPVHIAGEIDVGATELTKEMSARTLRVTLHVGNGPTASIDRVFDLPVQNLDGVAS